MTISLDYTRWHLYVSGGVTVLQTIFSNFPTSSARSASCFFPLLFFLSPKFHSANELVIFSMELFAIYLPYFYLSGLQNIVAQFCESAYKLSLLASMLTRSFTFCGHTLAPKREYSSGHNNYSKTRHVYLRV